MSDAPSPETGRHSFPGERPPQLLSLLKLPSTLTLPPLPETRTEYYLFERYSNDRNRWKRRAYYFFKPLIPRPLQLKLRRSYARLSTSQGFPSWPVEPILVDQMKGYLKEVQSWSKGSELYRISPWPHQARFCFVITHDVEGSDGLRNAPALADIERDLGFVSSWNIVPERYSIDWTIVDELRSRGCEIGVHGLRHDGKDFASRKTFLRRVQRINDYGRQWGAAGFRAPSTIRNVDWMSHLRFEYDSSFPDTDPYEPQPGGCCSIWPFFIDNLVELPLTMPQDHTLFEILGHTDLRIWKQKAGWIEKNLGLVLINVHPDYVVSAARVKLYVEFLQHMRKKEGMWHALPRDVARWWRERDASQLCHEGASFIVEGPASTKASVIKVTLDETGTRQEEALG